ncbi:MAG TPA: hypothetical protein PLJ54_12185 [Rhodoglobus sp.]|nr:hypothetical protein [Rhodoglobus sp.]HQI67127.1 hypothetical protein [Rhodoglobus sp.]
MLLTRIRSALTRDDRGAALAAAMSLMLLGALLSVLILSSVVATFSATTGTRATVQSEASAQAGIDVALASVMSGNCVSSYTSTTVPKYSVAVSYTTSPTLSTPGLTWVSGCPTASAPFMKITSTGTAGSPAVGTTTFGNSEAVEAIYARPVSTAILQATGPAVYAYSSQSFAGSGTLVSLDGTNDADVMIKTGDVACSGGAAAKGDFVVNEGNLTLSGSCGVTGNVWASGSGKGVINLSGGVVVGGNAVGNGLIISSGSVGGSTWTTGATTINSATIGGGVTVTANNFVTGGSNKIGGNLWASGSAELTNGDDVKGNATAQTLKLSGGNVGSSASNEAWSRGDVTGVTWFTIKSHLTAKSVPSGMTAGGGITVVPAGPGAGGAAPATPTSPIVPNWVNFTYQTSDWPGYTVATLGTTCTSTTLQTAINSFSGGKGVIDARACTAPIFMGGSTKVALSNDVAIISTYGFDLSYSKGGGGFSSTVPVDLFLITPDTTAESPATPTCPSGSSILVGGGFTFSSTISTIIYTPCKAAIGSGINFYGQVFAGQAVVDGAAKLFYTTVGLPGWNLDTGTTSSVTSSPNAWASVSTRNVTG